MARPRSSSALSSAPSRAPGCGRGVARQGLCVRHAQARERAGRPALPQWLAAVPVTSMPAGQALCQIAVCDLWAEKDIPFCNGHGKTWKTNGRPGIGESTQQPRSRTRLTTRLQITIESTFATVRHRTKITKGPGSRAVERKPNVNRASPDHATSQPGGTQAKPVIARNAPDRRIGHRRFGKRRGPRRAQISHSRVPFGASRQDSRAARNDVRRAQRGFLGSADSPGSGGQPAMPYAPTTVPLTGAGPSVQRSLMADTNSPNAGSAASGL